jgi:hypothetical protein
MGEAYLGRVIKALAKPIDERCKIIALESCLIKSSAPVEFTGVMYMNPFKHGLLLSIQWPP